MMASNGEETEVQVSPPRVRGGEEKTFVNGNRDGLDRIPSDREKFGHQRVEASRRDCPRQRNPRRTSHRKTTTGGILHRLIRGTEDRLVQLKAEIVRLEEDLAEFYQLEEDLERRVVENPRSPDEPKPEGEDDANAE